MSTRTGLQPRSDARTSGRSPAAGPSSRLIDFRPALGRCQPRSAASSPQRPTQFVVSSTFGWPAVVLHRVPSRVSARGSAGNPHVSAACVEEGVGHEVLQELQEPLPLDQQLWQLQQLLAQLRTATSHSAKAAVLERQPRVTEFFTRDRDGLALRQHMPRLSACERYVLLCLPAMGQEHVLHAKGGVVSFEHVKSLAESLTRVDLFYDSLGGLVGYQAKCLSLISEAAGAHSDAHPTAPGNEPADGSVAHEDLAVPAGLSLQGGEGCRVAAAATVKGLAALPAMAEIYPLGGAGDRLGLTCEATGECLPTAVLPYCGRTLLEGLVRDVAAREYLYYKLHGVQHVTPIAVMTSDAKGNHRRVLQLLKSADWFGRGAGSFRLFRQPLVPVVAGDDGAWVASEGYHPLMKPGGHGAIWKLMLDEGVFDWLAEQRREAAIVRQISNPLAGTDNMLLALSGFGHFDGKAFGFASCERTVGASEGINVLRKRQVLVDTPAGPALEHEYGVTCVEYTEFKRLGIHDAADGDNNLSKYPANTNVLYVGLQAARAAVVAGVLSGGGAALPGMVLNLSKKVSWRDVRSGQQREAPAGRLECTMQNLADSFAQRFKGELPQQQHGDLDTFVVFNERRKVTSSAKRKREVGSLRVAQTPDGSLLDLQRNARELLSLCGMQLPQPRDVADALARGPGFLFLFHPALGPLWSVVAQKLRGGCLAEGAELVLEVAEAQVTDLHLRGSLLVHAECVMGARGGQPGCHLTGVEAVGAAAGGGDVLPHGTYDAVTAGKDAAASGGDGTGPLRFSSHNGRVRLLGCRVDNAGVDWAHPGNVVWKHRVERVEALSIVLEGRSEFEARGVTFRGPHTFRVPCGYRMVVRAAPDGRGLAPELIPLGPQPSWDWRYRLVEEGSEVALSLHERNWWAPGQAPLPHLLLGGEDMAILI